MNGINCRRRADWKGFTYCIMALVLRVGSSGLKFLYSSTSFSIANSWDCSLLRTFGNELRMWLVSCWLRTRWRYGVPIRSAMCLHYRPHSKKIKIKCNCSLIAQHSPITQYILFSQYLTKMQLCHFGLWIKEYWLIDSWQPLRLNTALKVIFKGIFWPALSLGWSALSLGWPVFSLGWHALNLGWPVLSLDWLA